MSAVPGRACALDGNGNPQRSELLKIISYFRSVGGVAAQLDSKRMKGMARKGLRYIMSNGMGKTHHLAPGVWLVDKYRVAPVLMFVKIAKHSQRLDYMGIANKAVQRTFAPAYQKRMANALRTSK